MRVITRRTADSLAIGTGSLTCGFFNISMALQNKNPKLIQNTSRSSVVPHRCDSDPNSFCYVCGELKLKKNLKKFTEKLKSVYKECFASEVRDGNHYWLPQLVCSACKTMMDRWKKNKNNKGLKFTKPIVWGEPENKEDCYFCMTKRKGYNSLHLHKITYANVSSVTKPIISTENVDVEDQEVDLCSSLDEMEIDGGSEEEYKSNEGTSENDNVGSEDEYVSSNKKNIKPQTFNQEELSDLIRELGLPKDGAELLASRLKEKNLLSKGTKVSIYRTRDKSFRKYFTQDEDLVYCHDVTGLMNDLKKNVYKAEEWRLFIDSSKRSLKAVLLHNSNKYAPIPIAHSVTLKEEYKNIEIVLHKIKYSEHNWQICGDLKILSMILGQQSGFTKFPCFLCLWDSRDRENHYVKIHWPARESMEPGSKNVISKPLVEPSKILLPPLHIKLGLMKQFVKALNKDGSCYAYLANKFSAISDAKLKEGIFDGPQIRTMLRDEAFVATMNAKEKAAWLSFKEVVENFLGNHKSENYEELVADMLRKYQQLGCLMNYKLHFLHSHLDYFPENLGDYSEEQGERFHQDIKEMERRYQGRWDINMMADFCWMLMRESVVKGRKRKRNPLHRSFEDKRVRKHKRS